MYSDTATARICALNDVERWSLRVGFINVTSGIAV
jgi:hypothetical protein